MIKNYKLFTTGLIALAVNSVNAQCPIPSLVTASPSTLCLAGATTTLNATAAGSSINWFTVPTGGVAIGASASGANFTITPGTTTTYYAESYVLAVGSTTFAYTGAIQNYTVPAGVTSLTIQAKGAQGGNNVSSSVTSGLGADIKGSFTVTPGTVFKVLVGQSPLSSNGGGGGSFVTDMVNSPLIIAGGGGGSAEALDSPNKHGQVGTSGGNGAGGGGVGGTAGNGGNIGASFASGAGGGLLTNGTNGWTVGSGGISFVSGGAGGTGGAAGGFGGGGSGSGYVVGAGGGGYSGGGGGSNSLGTGGVGGGGGSFNGGTSQVNVGGVNAGDGQIIIIGSTFGCVSASRTAVMVVVGSTPTISVSNATICSGNSYTIMPSGASTYTYSSGSAVVTPTVNTSYSVTGTSSLGCVGSNTAISSVTVNANPSVTSSTSNSLICAGENVVLTASTTATSYTWNTGATTMSVSVSPSVTTTYTVNVSNAAACVASSTIMVTVNACTGINEVVANSISVYPNPNNGILNISLTSELSKNSSLEVYDAIGKLVVKQILANELNTINISNLNNGIYTFKVLNNSNIVKIGKIVIQ